MEMTRKYRIAVNFKVSIIKLWQNKYNKQLDLIFEVIF